MSMQCVCTICMSNLSVNEAANAASCGHVFHEPCLVQWFQRSRTCPQCRARCDDRQVRRLYFSAALNNSTVDVNSLQVDVDDMKLEMRNWNTEHAAKKALMGLEAELKLAKVELQNAMSQIASHKRELDRLRAVEKELTEKMQQANNLEYINSIIDSEAVNCDVAELLRSQTDVKTLATLVSVCKQELIKCKRNVDEVKAGRRVCQEENAKLKKRIRDLTDKIKTLESDNYKLQDDVSIRSKTVSSAQSSSLIYNGFGSGFGGSERQENFVGFPNGQSKSNPAGGKSLSMPLSSTKNGVTKK